MEHTLWLKICKLIQFCSIISSYHLITLLMEDGDNAQVIMQADR